MKVIIIAAGSATRLGKLSEKKPKCLLEINGKSILQRQIELFKKYGIDDIIIITGPHKKFGIDNVTYVEDLNYPDHDVLGSLMAAESFLNGKVLTCYSDILFDEEILKQILNFNGQIGIPIDLDWEKNYIDRIKHPKSEADNVILNQKTILKIKKNISFCNSNEVIGEFLGPVIFSENGSKIFVETYKKLRNTHNGNFHNSSSLKKAYLTDMIQELIDNDIKIDPIIISGKWCEIDTVEDFEKAELLFN
jgi:choline kinase|tara:strand:+ start:119 stop:865 length:747 start_codon:yes stop_codon:yes gene_type:complete